MREEFAKTALVFTEANGTKHTYKFIYATQRPLMVCCQLLRPIRVFFDPELATADYSFGIAQNCWKKQFITGSTEYMFDCKFPFAAGVIGVHVLPGLLNLDDRVVTRMTEIDFQAFTAGLRPREFVEPAHDETEDEEMLKLMRKAIY